MLPLHGLAFFGFNALRLLSVVATLLVFASTLMVMVLDGREYKAAQDGPEDDYIDCEYFPGTDVPTHVWGIFWVQLDRTFVLILLLLCVLSEINWGGKLQQAFEYCLPILGRTFGMSSVGALQMMVSTNLLSHYLDDFPLVTAWLLAIVGLINFLCGFIFHQRQRDYRSMSPSRRATARGESRILTAGMASYKPTLTASNTLEDPVAGQLMPTISASVAALNRADAIEHAQRLQREEVFRSRARQDNAQAELVEEMRQASSRQDHSDTTSVISGAFMCDDSKAQPFVIGRPHSREATYPRGVMMSEKTLSRQPSLSQWSSLSMPHDSRSVATTVWPQVTGQSAISRQRALGPFQAHLLDTDPRSQSRAGSVNQRNAIKRKSLALARAARKRLSAHSSRMKLYSRPEARPAVPAWQSQLVNKPLEGKRNSLSIDVTQAMAATQAQVARERSRLEGLARELNLSSARCDIFGNDDGQPSPAYEEAPRHVNSMDHIELNMMHHPHKEADCPLPAYQASNASILRPQSQSQDFVAYGLGTDNALPIAGRYQSEWTGNAARGVGGQKPARHPSYK